MHKRSFKLRYYVHKIRNTKGKYLLYLAPNCIHPECGGWVTLFGCRIGAYLGI